MTRVQHPPSRYYSSKRIVMADFKKGKLCVEYDLEEDGRWIAEPGAGKFQLFVLDTKRMLPGVEDVLEPYFMSAMAGVTVGPY